MSRNVSLTKSKSVKVMKNYEYELLKQEYKRNQRLKRNFRLSLQYYGDIKNSFGVIKKKLYPINSSNNCLTLYRNDCNCSNIQKNNSYKGKNVKSNIKNSPFQNTLLKTIFDIRNNFFMKKQQHLHHHKHNSIGKFQEIQLHNKQHLKSGYINYYKMSSWIDCKVNNDYEIFTEFPFYIRKKSNKRIVKEGINAQGYPRVSLDCVQYYKHRIVAVHFLPNDQPLIKTEVDHINRDKTDYHIENLRWVSIKENNINKSSHLGVEYEIIDYEDLDDDDLVEVRDYGKHNFEDYYYSPNNNLFYFDTGVNLRVLHINFDKRNGSAFVYTRNTENKSTRIYFTKFKKLYGFD